MEIPARPRIAILNSSLSEDSHTRILCRRALDYAQQQGMDAFFLDLRDYRVLPYGHEDLEGIEELEVRLGSAHGILLGSPVYNFGMSASLKALIEQCGDSFKGKVVGIAMAAGGPFAYMSAMGIAQTLMLDFRAWIVPRHVYATREDFADDRIANPSVAQRLEQLVDALYRAAWQHQLSLPER